MRIKRRKASVTRLVFLTTLVGLAVDARLVLPECDHLEPSNGDEDSDGEQEVENRCEFHSVFLSVDVTIALVIYAKDKEAREISSRLSRASLLLSVIEWSRYSTRRPVPIRP